MKFKYCPKCGRKLTQKYSYDEGGVPYCEYDDNMYFDTPKPCIIAAVMKDEDILLLKQSYTFKNSKVLISGYIQNGETAEAAVIREIKEETGIDVKVEKYLGSEFLIKKEIIMFTFMTRYIGGELNKSSEVEEADWLNINQALEQMKEDEIGKRVVNKVLKEINKKRRI